MSQYVVCLPLQHRLYKTYTFTVMYCMLDILNQCGIRESDRRKTIVLTKKNHTVSLPYLQGNRFDRMIQSSTDYIMNVIPDESKLGIVVFSSSSQIKAYLIDINGTASRQSLVNVLPPSAGGGTCIECGIRSGIQVT